MAFEFHLRAKIKRAEKDFLDTKDHFTGTYIARQTSYMITEGLYEIYQKVKKRGPDGYTRPEQYESDFEAASTLWTQTERTHEARLKEHYDAEFALGEARHRYQKLEKQLSDVLHGREEWVEVDEPPGAWEGGEASEQSRKFYHLGRDYHFRQTFPSPPPPSSPLRQKPKSAPLPRPPRSPSPPLFQSEPQPKPDSFPQPKKPTPFRRPATVRPDQTRIDNWFDEVDTALANPSTLRSFPQPPQWICERQQSKTECPKVALGLCRCCFASMFEGKDLKADRTKFHPDKFSRVPENARAGIQQVTSEIFKWIDAYYRERQEDKTRGKPRYYWE